jgi:glycosyltransferase involved in cell wall biosynthesis
MKLIKNITIVWEQEEIGGVDSYLIYLLKSDFFSKLNITIVTNKNNNALARLQNELFNVNFIIYENFLKNKKLIIKAINYIFSPIFFFFNIFRFRKILKKIKSDVILFQCGNYGYLRSEQAAILSTIGLNIPVKTLVVHHACRKPPIFYSFIIKFIDFFITKILSSLILVSYATKTTFLFNSTLLDSGKLETLVIHNGVPKSNLVRENYLHSTISIDNKKIRLGMLSRMEENKGFSDLLTAFSLLEKKIQDNFAILIVGKHNKTTVEKLEKLANNLNIRDKVFFLDYVKIDSRKILSSFDLFFSLTKNFEGFGLSLAEAMSVGTPVVSTDVGAINEFLDENCGKIIKPGNINEISNAISDFYENREDWIKKAAHARKKINDYFSDYKMSENYKNYFLSKFNSY